MVVDLVLEHANDIDEDREIDVGMSGEEGLVADGDPLSASAACTTQAVAVVELVVVLKRERSSLAMRALNFIDSDEALAVQFLNELSLVGQALRKPNQFVLVDEQRLNGRGIGLHREKESEAEYEKQQ